MAIISGMANSFLDTSITPSCMEIFKEKGTIANVFTKLSVSIGQFVLPFATIAKALPLIPFFDQLWLNTIKGVIILVVVVVNIVLQRTADKNALKGREM